MARIGIFHLVPANGNSVSSGSSRPDWEINEESLIWGRIKNAYCEHKVAMPWQQRLHNLPSESKRHYGKLFIGKHQIPSDLSLFHAPSADGKTSDRIDCLTSGDWGVGTLHHRFIHPSNALPHPFSKKKAKPSAAERRLRVESWVETEEREEEERRRKGRTKCSMIKTQTKPKKIINDFSII
jgi:hypothetical protein